jgi:hypothetical protein
MGKTPLLWVKVTHSMGKSPILWVTHPYYGWAYLPIVWVNCQMSHTMGKEYPYYGCHWLVTPSMGNLTYSMGQVRTHTMGEPRVILSHP